MTCSALRVRRNGPAPESRGETSPRGGSLELHLLLPDGSCRHVECHVDQDGPEEIVHLRDLEAESGRRQLLDGLATLGATLRAERDEQGVHARLRRELSALGAVSALLRLEEGRSRIVWVTLADALRREFGALTGASPEDLAGPASAFARQVVAEGSAALPALPDRMDEAEARRAARLAVQKGAMDDVAREQTSRPRCRSSSRSA